jgi:hypothetical protein
MITIQQYTLNAALSAVIRASAKSTLMTAFSLVRLDSALDGSLAEGYTYAREDAPVNVKFRYMYRDASNYKQNGVAVFSNHDYLELDEIEKQIRACLQDGQFFIARQVHIRERFFDTLHDDDHPWHEFNGLDTTMQALYDPEHWNQKARIRDIKEFLANLEAAHRAGWDETLVRPDVAALQERQKQGLKAAPKQGKDILAGGGSG